MKDYKKATITDETFSFFMAGNMPSKIASLEDIIMEVIEDNILPGNDINDFRSFLDTSTKELSTDHEDFNKFVMSVLEYTVTILAISDEEIKAMGDNYVSEKEFVKTAHWSEVLYSITVMTISQLKEAAIMKTITDELMKASEQKKAEAPAAFDIDAAIEELKKEALNNG